MFIVQIAGRLGKDPETRYTPSGQKVTTFTIATNHRKGKEDVTVWVRVTVWGDRLDKIISYLKKGSAVIVIGKFNPPSSYVDKEGRTQFALEVTAEMIEFSPFGRDEKGNEGQNSQGQQQQGGYFNEENGGFQSQGNKNFSYSAQTANGQGQGDFHNEEDLPF